MAQLLSEARRTYPAIGDCREVRQLCGWSAGSGLWHGWRAAAEGEPGHDAVCHQAEPHCLRGRLRAGGRKDAEDGPCQGEHTGRAGMALNLCISEANYSALLTAAVGSNWPSANLSLALQSLPDLDGMSATDGHGARFRRGFTVPARRCCIVPIVRLAIPLTGELAWRPRGEACGWRADGVPSRRGGRGRQPAPGRVRPRTPARTSL